MSGQGSRHLLIDIGNSRIKYALVEHEQDEIKLQYCESVAELAAPLKLACKVLGASVGKKAMTDELVDMCHRAKVECEIITTQAQQFDLICAYENYSSLGVDRWLAMLGARKLTDAAIAVIDLGTANTCDVVIGKQHLGGWIAPGFNLMKQSLIANTQKVFADNDVQVDLLLGLSTPQCVNMGCLAAVQGFVSMAVKILENKAENYQIIVTGGDLALIKQLKHPNLVYFPNLVLLGLSRFIS